MRGGLKVGSDSASPILRESMVISRLSWILGRRVLSAIPDSVKIILLVNQLANFMPLTEMCRKFQWSGWIFPLHRRSLRSRPYGEGERGWTSPGQGRCCGKRTAILADS